MLRTKLTKMRQRSFTVPVLLLVAAGLSAAPKGRPTFDYRFASGRSWFAATVEPGVKTGEHHFFWQAALGGFLSEQQLKEAYRARLGYRFQGLDVQWGIERNTIEALARYGPPQSVYQGTALQLGWTSRSALTRLKLRSILALMGSNAFPGRKVLLNQLTHQLVLYRGPSAQMALHAGIDFIIDLDDNGNKIAGTTALPFRLAPRSAPAFEFTLIPRFSHTQLTSRQAAGGILDDFIYRPNQQHVATTLFQTTAEARVYPLHGAASPLLANLFASVGGAFSLYRLAPQPWEDSQADYRLGASFGWGRQRGVLGVQLDYNPRDHWRFTLLYGGHW